MSKSYWLLALLLVGASASSGLLAADAPTAVDKPGAGSYSGHGADSISTELLQRFAPRPVPTALSTKIQAMMDVRAPSNSMLSPDGKTMYFNWRVTGVPQVWKIDGPLHFPIQVTGGQDATTLNEISPDGKYLLVSRDHNGEENPGLYWQDVNGGALHEIQHKRGVQTTFQFVSDDSRYVYFRANDLKPDAYALYRYDFRNSQIETVYAEPGIWLIADHRGEHLLLGKEVGSNMVEYYDFDQRDKSLESLFGQGEREDYSAAYGAQAGEIIVSTPHFSDFRRLYSWRNGKFTAISPELNADISRWTIDHARQRILYNVNEQGYTRLAALSATTFKAVPLPKMPIADQLLFGETTHNDRYTVLTIDSGIAPLQTAVLNWSKGSLANWHSGSAPEVDLSQFVRAKREQYPARDGTAIPVFVREPKQCKPLCPVIVSFHGGPESQTLAGFSTNAQLYVDAGFIVVQPNVRGSDGYGKTWIHADDGAKRLQVITDIDDAAIWARKRFAKDGAVPKVGITGGSYGGYSTLIGMTLFAGAYDAGVEQVGMSNLLTFLQNTAPYRRALRASEYGDPERDHDALLALSPITYINKLNAPLLMIQGASDPRVPVGEAVQFHDALQARGIDNDLLIFADEGHGAQKRENQVTALAYTLRFFEKQLMGKASE